MPQAGGDEATERGVLFLRMYNGGDAVLMERGDVRAGLVRFVRLFGSAKSFVMLAGESAVASEPLSVRRRMNRARLTLTRYAGTTYVSPVTACSSGREAV